MDSLPLQTMPDERRGQNRITVDSLAIVSSNDRERTTRLVNISAGGALVGPLFGVAVGDRARLDVPGYGAVYGVVARLTDDNYAAICFSPDPDFRELCEQRSHQLTAMIRDAQMAFENPHLARMAAEL